jgi:hypothetical protein
VAGGGGIRMGIRDSPQFVVNIVACLKQPSNRDSGQQCGKAEKTSISTSPYSTNARLAIFFAKGKVKSQTKRNHKTCRHCPGRREFLRLWTALAHNFTFNEAIFVDGALQFPGGNRLLLLSADRKAEHCG